MSASWDGAVALAEADALPGHYYVTVQSRGKTVLALGPFTQRRPGKDAHCRALGAVRALRRYVAEHDRSPHAAWYAYGTSRLPLQSAPPAGALNGKVAA